MSSFTFFCGGKRLRRFAVGLLAVLTTGAASAATYRYNGNAPPAKMMLDMMEAMGVIERVPDGDYGYRRWPVTSLWGLSPLSSGAAGWPGANPMLWSLLSSGGMTPGGLGWPGTGVWPGVTSPGAWVGLPGRFPGPAEGVNAWRDGGASWLSNAPTRFWPGEASLGPALEGIWLGDNGALLQFSLGEFTWKGGEGDVNVGSYRVVGNILITRVPRYDLTVKYRIRISGNRLVAVSEKGYRYEFVRSP